MTSMFEDLQTQRSPHTLTLLSRHDTHAVVTCFLCDVPELDDGMIDATIFAPVFASPSQRSAKSSCSLQGQMVDDVRPDLESGEIPG